MKLETCFSLCLFSAYFPMCGSRRRTECRAGGTYYPMGFSIVNQRLIKDCSYLPHSDSLEHHIQWYCAERFRIAKIWS